MAEEPRENTQEEPARKSGFLTIVLVAIVSLAAGVATPIVFAKLSNSKETSPGEPGQARLENDKREFISFGAVTVNLDSDRLNRFLHVDISLQIRESNKQEVEKQIELHKQILNNWLISFLADQNLEEIRGANGHNRLRREIRNQFNALLFKGGTEKIEDVLFQEFNVQ